MEFKAPKLVRPVGHRPSGRVIVVERPSPAPASHPFPSIFDRNLYPNTPKVKPKTRHQTRQVTRDDGDDGLLDWAYEHMQRAGGPKSARDIVDAWFSCWRGHPDKPPKVTKRFKKHHVDRIAKWLLRQHGRGLLNLHDQEGKWGSKRYAVPEGGKLRRPVRSPKAQTGTAKRADETGA